MVTSGVVITVALMALTIIFLTSIMASLYRKAGPHEALVVYGFRGTRVIKGHGTVIFPMIETCRQLVAQRQLSGAVAAWQMHWILSQNVNTRRRLRLWLLR